MIETYNALPDTRRYALTQEFFANRLDQPSWNFKWKENLADGPFWRKGSVRFQSGVAIPVYIIGGLLDGYRDTVVRLLNSPKPQVKADIGPWKHEWQGTGTPGPNYEWRKKALKWWDHWLKGIDNGSMGEPRFAVFMRDSVPPSEDIITTPGEWRCGNWPVGGIKERRFYQGENRRLASAPPDNAKPYMLAYKAGAGSGIHGRWGKTSGNMAFDDQRSTVFDSEPLKESVEIMGLPKVNLTVSADAPLYQWSVRLENV